AYPMPDPVVSEGSHARSGASPPDARTGYQAVRIPVRGPEYPTIRPNGTGPGAAASGPPPAPAVTSPAVLGSGAGSSESLVGVADPTGLMPPVGGDGARFDQPRTGESVYRTRRPVSSYLVAAVMLVLAIPLVRLFVRAAFVATPQARVIVPAVLLAL